MLQQPRERHPVGGAVRTLLCQFLAAAQALEVVVGPIDLNHTPKNGIIDCVHLLAHFGLYPAAKESSGL